MKSKKQIKAFLNLLTQVRNDALMGDTWDIEHPLSFVKTKQVQIDMLKWVLDEDKK